jgi:N-acetylmuramoyl-L-alanine amidase
LFNESRTGVTSRPAARSERYLTLLVLLFALIYALLVLVGPAQAGTQIASARVWSALDYTRVTLETATPVSHALLTLKDPDRLVLDLQGVDITAVLTGLSDRIGTTDPYIKGVRVGRFKPDVVRLVFDLKSEVKPQLFALPPVGDYGHRLVLDLYPLVPPDPLLAFLEKHQSQREEAAPPAEAPAPGAKPQPSLPPASASALPSAPRPIDTKRLIIIAVDAGHGGEDPGARGQGGTSEKDVTLAIARKLKTRIDQEPNMKAILTRDGDYFVPLHMRVEKARRVKADLFVSVHADSWIRPDANGSSVFALSEHGASSAAARLLAKRENDADLIGGVNLNGKDQYLAMTLADLSLTAQINDSLKLGTRRAGRAGRHQQSAQAPCGAGGFRGVEGAQHPFDPGGNRIHQQSAGGTAAEERGLPGPDGRRRFFRNQALLLQKSPAVSR